MTGSRTLTPEQVAAFNRDGYLKPLRVFDAAEIADIREYFDRLLAQTLPRAETAIQSVPRI